MQSQYFPVVVFSGTAYALDGRYLMHAPILTSGTVDEDMWAHVESREAASENQAAREQLKELHARRFRIEWINYANDPAPAIKPLPWFVDEQGFTRDDQAGILALKVGESYTSGMGETVRIERLPNEATAA